MIRALILLALLLAALPADVVAKTRDKYLEACRLLTGSLPEGVG
jgi:hypothetical protein